MQHKCGLYRAVVVANDDPQLQGRIKVICPQLWGEAQTDWFSPHLPSETPVVGSVLVIGFEAGDEDHPIWFGKTL